MAKYIKGDHLVTNIDMFGITEHHGLYIGSGEVIHLTAEDGKVVQTRLDSFSDGGKIRVKRGVSTSQKAIMRARSKLGRKGYNLITNNCEHFVNWCIDGKKVSKQVTNTYAAAHLAKSGIFGGVLSGLGSIVCGVVDSQTLLLGAEDDFVC